MSTKTQITCPCGQRVLKADVLQKGQFLRLFCPGFIYIKFRCSRCKRMGERFVGLDGWDEDTLQEVPCEASREERMKFSQMGGIQIDEVIDFHYRLDDLSLSDLREEFE
jgi:DNA-directed RNA polymerase subunit RPC12/RpoP